MEYDGLIGTFGVLRRRFFDIGRREGAWAAIAAILRLGFFLLFYPLFKLTRGSRSFRFNGRQYKYFCHWYNTTYDNERSVEIALTLEELKQRPNAHVLEVGHVLSHYVPCHHDILDKYEVDTNVMNQDILDFHPSELYDLIVSISTIEHVGFDEFPQDPMKIPAAIAHLAKCLTPGGRLFVTLPVAYNKQLDRLLLERDLFPVQKYMRRTSWSNKWVEVAKEEALHTPFNTPYSFGNAIVVGILDR